MLYPVTILEQCSLSAGISSDLIFKMDTDMVFACVGSSGTDSGQSVWFTLSLPKDEDPWVVTRGA